jgi:predicted PurR-regulated permease PerM
VPDAVSSGDAAAGDAVAIPEIVGAPVRDRLRLSGRSVVAAVAVISLTLLVLHVLASAERVIAWVLIASSVAALVAPAVDWLDRRTPLPRGLAVAALALAGLALTAGTTYGLVDAIVDQTSNLERRAPELARDIETDSRFATAATEADLSERTERFVKSVPELLRGGTPAEAIRSAATRGLAFLAVFVLTVFFLLHGGKLATAAARQIHDDERRSAATRIGKAVYHRAFGYARGTIVLAVLAGAVAYGLARAAGVPSPAPLAIWVALWDGVPLLGATVGALPIVVLAGVLHPARGVVLLIAFVGYQAFEYLVLQRRLEARTVKLGPFLTTAGGFAGLELYGLTGALLAVLALAVGAVVLDESTEP